MTQSGKLQECSLGPKTVGKNAETVRGDVLSINRADVRWGTGYISSIIFSCRKCPTQTRLLLTFSPILASLIPSTMTHELDSIFTWQTLVPRTPQNSPTSSSQSNATVTWVPTRLPRKVDDIDTGIVWRTLAPNCDLVNAHSTSKGNIHTSRASAEENSTGTASAPTAAKKTTVHTNGERQDTPARPALGRPLYKQRRVPKQKTSSYVRNPGTGSSTDVTSTTPWIRCGQCKRLKRFDYQGVLQTLICQLHLQNGN